MNLVDTPTGRRCTRHNVELDRGEVCHRCVTDPADAPSASNDDPEYQLELRARINEYRSNARACMGECNSLRKDGTAIDGNLAVKWSAEAIKWSRLAEEQQSTLDSRAHDLRLIAHEERMSGVRRTN